MTIQYSDGRAAEAVLLARTETTIRVAMQGADDVVEFSKTGGTWVSADCEPALIAGTEGRLNPVTEADCCCSREWAARLIHLLFTDSDEHGIDEDGPCESRAAFSRSDQATPAVM